MSIRVIKHVRGRRGEGQYIGRPHEDFDWQGSPLANPYHIGRDGTRAEVIEKFRQWLLGQVRNRKSAAYLELVRLAQIAEQGELILVCFCCPLACHGDVVKRAIEWVMRERARARTDQKLRAAA